MQDRQQKGRNSGRKQKILRKKVTEKYIEKVLWQVFFESPMFLEPTECRVKLDPKAYQKYDVVECALWKCFIFSKFWKLNSNGKISFHPKYANITHLTLAKYNILKSAYMKLGTSDSSWI